MRAKTQPADAQAMVERHEGAARKQIEDYALIGDLRTAALIATDGSIDWLSLPRFDSPAVYAALLGTEDHGHWRLAPVGKQRCTRRRYRPGTLILETDWTTSDGAVRVTDFMDPSSATAQVIRIVDGLVGEVPMRTTMSPRMTYGHPRPSLSRIGTHLLATADQETLWLDSDVPLHEVAGSWDGRFTVTPGQRVTFTLTHASPDAATLPAPIVGGRHSLPAGEPGDQLAATDTHWTDWSSRSTYTGPWADEVTASLVLLKALTYAPTGSILAAATTSLPEMVGGTRNWDYRFSWLRDATFAIQAFLATGYLEEAVAWRGWLLDAVGADAADVQIMYGIDGTRDLPEQTLDWLPGFAGSAPVRIGNAAAAQQQNDIWGEVLDVLTAMRDAGAPPAPGEQDLRDILLGHLLSTWQDEDHGLWEIRGPRRHFVHSKLMSWVGLDRAVQALQVIDRPGSADELAELTSTRDAIRVEILDSGFSRGRGAFTQSYGSDRLDASVLLMPAYGFLPGTDSRVVETIETIQRELTEGGLVQRYATGADRANVDGVPGHEGVFLATSFWLADALHGIGRASEAADLFTRLLSLRNDVGLLSEEYDPATGHQLGNTPQGFSHAAIVITALRLSRPADMVDTSGEALRESVAG